MILHGTILEYMVTTYLGYNVLFFRSLEIRYNEVLLYLFNENPSLTCNHCKMLLEHILCTMCKNSRKKYFPYSQLSHTLNLFNSITVF